MVVFCSMSSNIPQLYRFLYSISILKCPKVFIMASSQKSFFFCSGVREGNSRAETGKGALRKGVTCRRNRPISDESRCRPKILPSPKEKLRTRTTIRAGEGINKFNSVIMVTVTLNLLRHDKVMTIL